MSDSAFRISLYLCGSLFTAIFAIVVVPPLISNPDVFAAFAAGFVNPYSSGYSADVLVCWAILIFWVIRERRAYSVKNGWVCLLLGVVPGVAVGFAGYLLLRQGQIKHIRRDEVA